LFEPRSRRITLSKEVNVEKPDEKIFRLAINKIQKSIPYKNVVFVDYSGRQTRG
jgi:FMN phosphatase YigB (HAD superfamily)